MEPQSEPVPIETTVPNSNPVTPQPSDAPAPINTKAPLLVIIISWLLLISGVFQLIAALLTSSFGITTVSPLLSLLALIPFVMGIISITASVGLRKMKKWTFYLIGVATLISVVNSLSSFGSLSVQIEIGLDCAMLAYFWTIREKFV